MSLIMNEAEVKQIDSKVEQMMDWAKTRQAEAEQLALDSARLISCTSERMERLSNQGFFKRCWSRFTGEAGGMERANANDLAQMQKMAFSYINMLQEQDLLMAHSMLALKNNLLSLSIKEEETRNLVGILAQRTLDRFEKLESRVEQLEISTNLQGWLLGLGECDYDEKIPTKYMRLLRIINDFYSIKCDNWNFNDYRFMRKALRTVGIDPKQKISIDNLIDSLIDEIQIKGVGFDTYKHEIGFHFFNNIKNYSQYIVDNISSPIFISIHNVKIQYMDRIDMVEELQNEINCSFEEALKRLLKRSIKNLNVNISYKFPIAEAVMEIIGSIRLVYLLKNKSTYIDMEDKDIQIENDNLKIQESHLENSIETKQEEIKSEDVHKKILEEFDLNGLLGVATLENSSNYYVRGWECSPKLRRKVDAGLQSFGLGLSYDDVIAYYDNTIFGGGDEGFILTNDAIYYKYLSNQGYVPYSSIDKIKPRFTGFTISFGLEKIDITCTVGDIRDEICMAIDLLTTTLLCNSRDNV